MSIDRDAALKEAEQLLHQGQLDGAIEAYMRLVEDRPSDWSSINVLGDLYLRAGNVERAIAQFTLVADQFFSDGSLQKAAALYKKALRAQNDHEPALQRLSDIAVQQGFQAEAEVYLQRLAEQRQRRGDSQGAAEPLTRLSELKDAQARSRRRTAEKTANVLPVTDPQEAVVGRGEVAEIDGAGTIIVASDASETRTAEANTTEVGGPGVDAGGAAVGSDESGSDDAKGDVAGNIDAGDGVVDDANIVLASRQVVVTSESSDGSKVEEPEGQLHDETPARVDAPHEIEVPLDGERSELEALSEVELGDAPYKITFSLADTADVPVDSFPDHEPSEDGGDGDRGEDASRDAVANDNGEVDVEALELAARNPDARFSAAAALGRYYVRCGDLRNGTRWLERALSATPGLREEGFAVKHELADALESLGKPAHALTVLIDLDLDSGGYKDGRARIAQLMAAQMRSTDS